MIHENETADEKSYYSDYDEETDEELEKELPDATGKKMNLLEVTKGGRPFGSIWSTLQCCYPEEIS